MRTVRDVHREATRLWRLCHADGRLDDRRSWLVCDRLADPDRPVAPPVVSSFRQLLHREAVRYMARVESAVPLERTAQEAIDRLLVERYGDRVVTTFAVMPALIGGVRISIGSDVYDDSVRARLHALDARF